jgi:hypothetical protein
MRSGVSYLLSRAEVDPQRIGVWGHSVGAGVAIVAGVLDRRIGCVVGQNPSYLDPWAALAKSRGRTGMDMVREALQRDFDQRFAKGVGASIAALPNDPKISAYTAQSEELFPTFKNEMTLESLEHVLLWAPIHLIHRLAPSPLLMVTGVEDSVHAIDEVLKAYERAWQPKRLELLPVDEIGLSIEPGLGILTRCDTENHRRICRLSFGLDRAACAPCVPGGSNGPSRPDPPRFPSGGGRGPHARPIGSKQRCAHGQAGRAVDRANAFGDLEPEQADVAINDPERDPQTAPYSESPAG